MEEHLKCNTIRDSREKKGYFWSGLFFFIIIIFLIYNLEAKASIPILRVGIFLDCKEITLKGDQGLKIYEIPTNKTLFVQNNNKSLKITVEPQGIKINDQSFKIDQGIKVIPAGNGFLQVEDKKYRGEIEVDLHQSLLRVINIIGIEEYLYGVLKKEISPEWPAEVLKAQAIAARTFALSNMNKYIEQGYHLCATTNSQEYGGVFYEHPATNKAVNDTRGVVAVYKGEPINAVYHSDSGGCTENSEDVWSGYVPYLRSVPSEYEKTVSPPNYQWDCTLTEKEILSKLNQHGLKLNCIEEIIINEKTEAGRVKSIDIVGDNEQITLKSNDFRLLVGPKLIRSSLFTIEKKGGNTIVEIPKKSESAKATQDSNLKEKTISEILKEDREFTISELLTLLNRPKGNLKQQEVIPAEVEQTKITGDVTFTFHGRGNGHGVGLSQWGAYGMATLGYDYEAILKHYYQGIQLTKLY